MRMGPENVLTVILPGICNTREPAKCNVKCTKQPTGEAHRQFENIFMSSEIKEEEMTLDLILPNFSVTQFDCTVLNIR